MTTRDRYIAKAVAEDLSERMVFIGGPRQIGKTTVARDLVARRFPFRYYNWDKIDERTSALRGNWPADAELIILDEFHKYPKWKTWIKGEYDSAKSRYKFLLTGSARLNIYRRGGDSLQGRYHYYTLHPFSLAELSSRSRIVEPGQELSFDGTATSSDLETLMRFGGFPEPLLRQEARFIRRWHTERIERFFKEDVRDLTRIRDFGSIALLASVLPQRASAVLSINSLAQDLQVNFRTAAHWLDSFDLFYYSFRLSPYQARRIASVRKEKKLYLWDWSQVEDEGARMENLVASHLLKYCDFLHENQGWPVALYYLRDVVGREVDFLVTNNDRPWFAVEVKLQDRALSRSLLYFKEKLKIPFCYQIVKNPGEDVYKDGVRIMPAAKFLGALI